MSHPDETLDPAEAGCRLLLISPPGDDLAPLARELDAALAVGGIAGFIVRLERAGQEPSRVLSEAARLRAICADHGVAFLLRDHVDLALEIGADGVHLGSGAAEVPATRAVLGPARILGVSCGRSRDAAMVAGEAGADYVAFGDLERPAGHAVHELLRWWSELFVLPCLAEVAATATDCAPLARAGADFIAAGAGIWTDPQGAAAAVRRWQEGLPAS